VWRAAHLRNVPLRAQVGGAHTRVGFEAAAGKDNRSGLNLLPASGTLTDNPRHLTIVVLGQADHRGVVAKLHTAPLGGGYVLLDKALAPTNRAKHQPSPESPLPVYLERLPIVHQPVSQTL